ncbi:hypothetical protein U9M48_023685 [Paspalum notatum var. saurae]|uniref:Reverse transcriptase domain-containing protein n=1 Tax=Paspalum notatum var. saurae TaxID=547442 RepID=A0AAQ3TPX7_PASNO
MLSSPITIATKPIRRSHRPRHRMAEGAGHRYFGTKRERSRCSGPTLSRIFEQQIKMVRENLRVARSRQKSYADVRRGDLTFKVDDFVYLKWKGKAKWLISWSCHQTYRHTQCVPCVPTKEVFKGLWKNKHPLEGLDVQEDLTYTEHPVKILETSERVTRNKRVKMCECGGNITRRMRQLGKKRRS